MAHDYVNLNIKDWFNQFDILLTGCDDIITYPDIAPVFSCGLNDPLDKDVYAEALQPNTITVRFDLGYRCTPQHNYAIVGALLHKKDEFPDYIDEVRTNVVSFSEN